MQNIQIVSLPSATARREQISRNLVQHGLRYEFFDALTGREALEHYGELVDQEFSQKILGRSMALGELGCALSHALLLRKFLEQSDLPFMYVFEDDIRILDHGTEALNSLAHRFAATDELIVFPSGYDFFPRLKTRTAISPRHRLYENTGPTWGTYGMFITRSVAHNLLADALPIVVPADYVGRSYGRHRVAIRGVWPPILFHPHFELFPEKSSIGKERALVESGPSPGIVPHRFQPGRILNRLSIFLRQLR